MDTKGSSTMKNLALIILLSIPALAFAQNAPFSDIVLSASGRPIAGASVSVCNTPGLATTGATVTSNIAVLTFGSSPITAGFAPGMTLQVSGFTGGDTYFNGGTLSSGVITGGFTILSVTATTVTYNLNHANASATSNGSAFQQGNSVSTCAPLATISSDAAGLSPITQPGLLTDGLGNYAFYAPQNAYLVQFSGATVTLKLKPISLTCLGGSAACSVSGSVNIASPGSLTVGGMATLANINGVQGIGSGIADLPTALGQTSASAPNDIDLTGASSNFTSAQTFSLAQTLRIRGRGFDINGNNNGSVLTYTPGGTGTSGLTINTSKPFSARSFNFSQGNSQATTNGIVLNGNQGALFDSVQLAGFTGNGLSINDSASSSGGPNLFLNMQTVLNGTGIKINSTNAGKASNTNVFVNLNSVLNSGIQFDTAGNSSDEHIFGAFMSSNASPIARCGDNTNSARGGAWIGVSLESGASPVSNQIGLQNNCQGLFAIGEFAPVSAGTPVPIQDGGIAGACHWLYQTSGVVAAGVHWESTCNPVKFNSFGATAIGSGCNPIGSIPGINFCANSNNSLSSGGTASITLSNSAPWAGYGPSNTAPSLTLKTGSGAGAYTNTNTALAAVDTTNLCTTITVPLGFKLFVSASGVGQQNTATAGISIALADAGATCTSGGITALNGSQRDMVPPAIAANDQPWHTQYVLTGDGSAHSIALMAKTANAADAWVIVNGSAVSAPSMVFQLMPSN